MATQRNATASNCATAPRRFPTGAQTDCARMFADRTLPQNLAHAIPCGKTVRILARSRAPDTLVSASVRTKRCQKTDRFAGANRRRLHPSSEIGAPRGSTDVRHFLSAGTGPSPLSLFSLHSTWQTPRATPNARTSSNLRGRFMTFFMKLVLRSNELRHKLLELRTLRSGWDSNPRYPSEYASLAKMCFRPLSHLTLVHVVAAFAAETEANHARLA
jgi:hypothetical protein